MGIERLREHRVILEGKSICGLRLTLRPMTEDDWDILVKWNNDPEVLYYAEGDDVTGRPLQDVQDLYRSVSREAFCFIIEADGTPIGECWLQKMNLKRILERHPGLDCRRIDLMIGEKQYWGQGIGTEAIRLLTEFGFLSEGADMIFGCDIADYNSRSLRAFQRVGYRVAATNKELPGGKATCAYDLAMTRLEFETRVKSESGRRAE